MAHAVGDELAELTLRPQVPMGAFQALGYVCAMGAVEGLRAAGAAFAAIGWPSDLVDGRTEQPLCELRIHAGYNRGMYATCTVVGARQVGLLRNLSDDELRQALETGIAARVASWEEQIAAGAGAAGPLAPVLSEYFDLVSLLGHPAKAVYPNGNTMAEGMFAGVDIWGRATLVTADGHEVEFSPEQARVRSA